MIASNKSRAAILGAAVVALATPAVAYYVYDATLISEPPEVIEATPAAEPTVTITEPASTSEPAVPTAEPIVNAAAPVAPVQEPPVTVYGERKTKDELMNEDVVKAIAADSRLSGYIGVETREAIVTLNGRVSTPGQATYAIRDAQSVEGVREVRNMLRARVGGAT